MDQNGKERILVLGGGYGGLKAALTLANQRSRFKPEITLIDRNDFHQFVTLWHEIAAASLEPDDISIPFSYLLANKRIEFRRETVAGFDFPNKAVNTGNGMVQYDCLIIALGSQSATFNIPGVVEHAFTIGSLAQAMQIRDTIISRFREAQATRDAAKRKALLTFVVGGGGFTGTELAGQLADWLPQLSLAHGIAPSGVRLAIVEASDQLLRGFDQQLVDTAREILARKGVDIRLGQPVAEVRPDGILLKSGEEIATRTFIWAGGVRANDLISNCGLKTGTGQRALINPFGESVDFENVYPIGDVALIVDPATNRPMAPSAQLAIQQGDFVARQIWHEALGRPHKRFVPHISAEVVSLGRRSAIAYLWGRRIDGIAAAILKQLTVVRYAYSIGGLRLAMDKARVLLPLQRWTERDLKQHLHGAQREGSSGAITRGSLQHMPGLQSGPRDENQNQDRIETKS